MRTGLGCWIAGGAMLALVPVFPAAAEDLTIQGSTTFNAGLLAPYLADIEAASGHTLAVIPNKSSLGLVALFEEGPISP